MFDKNEITSLIICYYTCGIEIRQRVLTYNNFKVYVYREKGNKHHCSHCHLELNEFTLVYNLENNNVLKSSFKNTKLEKKAIKLIVDNKEKILKEYQKVNI